jgi:gliding motility-associated-like protein
MKRHWSRTYNAMLCIIVCLSAQLITAQVLNKPEPQFTAPCASASYNTFQVRFKWDPPVVNNDNQFILELSEPDGSWDNPTQLAATSDMNATFDFNFSFGFPTNTASENYKVRVRSTSPAGTSPESDAFPAYYQNVTEGLVLNSFVGEIYVCDGTPATLSIDNYPSEHAYNWYRNGTLLTSERGATLTTTQAGFYYVEVDYGLYCSGSTVSNQVEIITGVAQGVAITGSYPQALCAGQTHTLQSNITDGSFMYQWFKDGAPISGANSPSYTIDTNVDTNFDADYTVEVEQPGGCKELSAPVTINRGGDFTVNITTPNAIVLMPSTTRTLGVTTSANSPSYTWYRNGIEITGETNSNITISQPGRYHATINQGGTCASSKDSEEIIVEVPDRFEITIATDTNYTDCSNTSTTLAVTEITAITSSNNRIDATADVRDNFSYQWLKNGAILSGVTAQSIAVNDASDNDIYSVEGTLGAYNATSNTVDVKLVIADDVSLSSNGTVSCDGGDMITITSATSNPSYTYEWYRNGILMSETTHEIDTNLSGTYRLGVTAYGCTKFSTDLVISPFDESLVTVDASDRVVFVEGGSRTVTAAGADTYAWYDSDNNILSSSSSYTFTEEGDYVLRAFIGSCEVIKLFNVAYQESFAVPNVITPNGDGINDQWIIPNTYAFNNEIEVKIFDPSGAPIFNAAGYQNNWPQNTLSFPSTKPPVFYYKIVKGKSVIKQGTITLIR